MLHLAGHTNNTHSTALLSRCPRASRELLYRYAATAICRCQLVAFAADLAKQRHVRLSNVWQSLERLAMAGSEPAAHLPARSSGLTKKRCVRHLPSQAQATHICPVFGCHSFSEGYQGSAVSVGHLGAPLLSYQSTSRWCGPMLGSLWSAWPWPAQSQWLTCPQ
jgi:hypothetical protein